MRRQIIIDIDVDRPFDGAEQKTVKMEPCENCDGTGTCPVCQGDDGACSWCHEGACPDCGGDGEA